MAIHKKTITDRFGNTELYVYMNGSLLYKRWSQYEHGKVFYNNLGA